MMASVPPTTNPDLLTGLATLKPEVAQLQKTTDRLEDLIGRLSKNLVDMKTSFEGVKTQLNYAIGVAVFLIGMTAPVIVKSFSSPAILPPASSGSMESERRMDRIEKNIERLTEEIRSKPTRP